MRHFQKITKEFSQEDFFLYTVDFITIREGITCCCGALISFLVRFVNEGSFEAQGRQSEVISIGLIGKSWIASIHAMLGLQDL